MLNSLANCKKSFCLGRCTQKVDMIWKTYFRLTSDAIPRIEFLSCGVGEVLRGGVQKSSQLGLTVHARMGLLHA
eukprot:5236934-Amphidinium_carterae.1